MSSLTVYNTYNGNQNVANNDYNNIATVTDKYSAINIQDINM